MSTVRPTGTALFQVRNFRISGFPAAGVNRSSYSVSSLRSTMLPRNWRSVADQTGGYALCHAPPGSRISTLPGGGSCGEETLQ